MHAKPGRTAVRRTLLVTVLTVLLLGMIPVISTAVSSETSAQIQGHAVSISSGHFNTCAASRGVARCWGMGNAAQNGNGDAYRRTIPTPVVGMTDATVIASGSEFTCALLRSGRVQCWGSLYGSAVPIDIAGITDATAMDASGGNVCAVLADHSLKCWGSNSGGQLRTNAFQSTLTPQTMADVSNVASVDVGYNDICVVHTDATAGCWGYNLGHYNAAPSSVRSISAGWYHACAVLLNGTVRCWGQNGGGELGNGTTTASSSPVEAVGITNAISVSAGEHNTCAVLGDGTAKCWGANTNGEVGDGTTTRVTTPKTVNGLDHVTAISIDSTHSCAAQWNREIRCWGANEEGWLGNGTVIASLVPVTAVGAFPIIEAPASPTSLIATPGDSSAQISFTAGADGGEPVANYEYQIDGSSWLPLDPTDAISPIIIGGLSNGTSASIRIRAVNDIGDSGAPSDPVAVSPRGVPSAPISVSATAGSESASIRFASIIDGGAPIEKFQFSVDDGGTWSDAQNGTSSPVTIPDLTNGVTYSIRIRAVNVAGPGAASSAVSVTPSFPAPAIGSVSSPVSHQILINWSTLTPSVGRVLWYRALVFQTGSVIRVSSCWASRSSQSCTAVRHFANSTTYDVSIKAVLGLGGHVHRSTLLSSPIQITSHG